MTFEQPERELPSIIWWGRRLLGICLGAMVFGGVIVHAAGLQGRGLDAVSLSILIPIWATGVAGIVLLLVGWVRYPALDKDLDFDLVTFGERSDGQVFGGFTRFLAFVTASLLLLSMLLIWMNPDIDEPRWKLGLICYCMSCYCGWVMYLAAFYERSVHHATSTYQNHLTPLIGFLLVPLTWPLLIVLNLAVRQHDRAAYDWDEEGELEEWD